jgi:hypothetical protein
MRQYGGSAMIGVITTQAERVSGCFSNNWLEQRQKAASPTTVSMKKRAPLGLILILCMTFFWGCSGATSSKNGVPPGPQAISVTVAPATSSVSVNATQLFAATVTGAANTAVTWSASGGTVAPNGLFTAPPTSGTFTVTATSVADTTKSAFATVTVTKPQAGVIVTINPQSVSLQGGAQQQFTATVTGTSNTSVTWFANSGSITSTGLYTAPSSVGSDTVTATSVADSTKSASANVSVTSSVVTVTISPTSVNLPMNGIQQFAASVTGTVNTAVTWSATQGNITAAGLYTAPASQVVATITATSVADPTKSASANALVGGAGSTLAQTAAVMQPGTWAQLTTVGFNAGNVLHPPDGGSVLEFDDKAVWNPVAKAAVILGQSHAGAPTACGTELFAAYSDASNTWSNLPLPCPTPEDINGVSHGYEQMTVDPATGDIYHRQYSSTKFMVFKQSTQTWISLASIPTTSFQCCGAVEYFPDRKSVIFLDGDWGVWEYSIANDSWTQRASTNGGGFSPQLTGLGSYQNQSHYSAMCQCVILGGGNGNSVLYKFDVNGNFTRIADAPMALNIPENPGSPNGVIFTADPVSGLILVWDGNGNANGTAWQYNPTTDTWSKTNISVPIFPSPDGGVTETVAIPISDYGVIMFVQAGSSSGGSVYLYKHK